jgi:hypothetical protein
MRCYVCSAENVDTSLICGNCGASMSRQAHIRTGWNTPSGPQPQYPLTPEAGPTAGYGWPTARHGGAAGASVQYQIPGSTPPLTSSSGGTGLVPMSYPGFNPRVSSFARILAASLNIAFSLLSVVLVVLVSAAVVTLRGGEARTVLEDLSLVHLLLALLVVVVYWLGSWLVTGQTLGLSIATRLTGESDTERRQVGMGLLPIVLATLIASTVAGLQTHVNPALASGPETSSGSSSESYGSGHGSYNTSPSNSPSTSASPSKSTSTSASVQAAAVDGILDASGSSRSKLGAALQKLTGCSDPAAALVSLREVGTERNNQLSQARQLQVSALPNGETLRSTLVEALNYSLTADQAFVAWGEATSSYGCAQDSNYEDGVTASKSATAAKVKLVELWNPIASTYGLATRTESNV